MAHIYQTVDIKATLARIREKAPDVMAGRDSERWTQTTIKALAQSAGVEPVLHPLWRFQFVDYDGQKRTVTGCATEAKTRKKAERMEAHALDVEDGIKAPPKPSDIPQDFETLVKEYVAWGLASGGRRGFGWSEQHGSVRAADLTWWSENLNLKTPADIRLPNVEKTLRELAKTKANKTVQRYAESLKAFCLWAVKRQYLDADPLKGLRKLDTTPQAPYRPLSVREVQALLEKAPAERQLLYRVALETGYRAGELRALQVGNLDPFGPALTLPAAATKNRKPARQFISCELAKELQAASEGKKESESLLFVPKQWATRNFTHDAKKAELVKTPVGKLSFHSLRVTFIQTVVEAGVDVKTAMEAARHGSATMTFERYAKPNADRQRKLAETVHSALNQVESGRMAAEREGTNDAPVSQPASGTIPLCSEKVVPAVGVEPTTRGL